APARELVFETDPDWTLVSVSGPVVLDSDQREHEGRRQIRVLFREPVLGRTLIEARMEKTLPDGATLFHAPAFRLNGAKSERGYLALRAETGIRLEAGEGEGLREVHTGSLPVRLPDAQQAFRFRDAAWKLPIQIRRVAASMHADAFHLVSLGETGLYGSCTITYTLSGAPVRSFRLRIPDDLQNVEITGRDVRSWARSGDEWIVSLQERILGDYTLLVTYHRPMPYEGGQVRIGEVEALGVETESGFAALAGSASFQLGAEAVQSPSMQEAMPEDLPPEYRLLIGDSLLRVWSYAGSPHVAEVAVRRFAAQPLPGQVADHLNLATRIGEDGEMVTTATYHVKNTREQYLALRLPEGADLWSVTVENQTVRAFRNESGETLVPLERRRNPDEPIRVEAIYAQKSEPFGALTRLGLEAPAL
ncbi:MAG: hypothetical protein U1E27_12500, partial [Kiritimatiellia bacterium]|nr:hypothetical protein [Kiritimatiellia bacterium]